MRDLAALALAVGGAVFLALGCVLQWLGHQSSQRRSDGIWKVAFQWRWIAGIASSAVGTGLHYAALWLGHLALVLPVSSLHIVFTALGMSWLRKEAVVGNRALGIGLVASGVLVCALAEAGVAGTDRFQAGGVASFAALTTLGCGVAWYAMRRAHLLSILGGSCYAVAALAMKSGSSEPPAPMLLWGGVFAASYLGGFAFLQAAFRRGGAGMVNALATGSATALALVGAVWVLDEPVRPFTWIGATAIAVGVLVAALRRWSFRPATR